MPPKTSRGGREKGSPTSEDPQTPKKESHDCGVPTGQDLSNAVFYPSSHPRAMICCSVKDCSGVPYINTRCKTFKLHPFPPSCDAVSAQLLIAATSSGLSSPSLLVQPLSKAGSPARRVLRQAREPSRAGGLQQQELQELDGIPGAALLQVSVMVDLKIPQPHLKIAFFIGQS